MMRIFSTLLFLLISLCCSAQIDSLKYVQVINNTSGGLISSTLSADDKFGRVVEIIGDVNLDGVLDIAVGAHKDDDGSTDQGAIYILMLNEDGTVKDQQKISATEGNGPAFTSGHSSFGSGIAALGDLNGDGKVDIAVGGAACDDDGVAAYKGAVYILFLDTNGTVLEYQKISNTQGGGPGTLGTQDGFGAQVSNIGDLNGDDLPEIAIWTLYDDDGGTNVGATFIGFLDYNGTLKNIQKISADSGSFGGALSSGDQFGFTRGIGDINNDGVLDIAIGASGDDDEGTNKGAVWICLMNNDGTVSSEQRIGDSLLVGEGLDNVDRFGMSVAGLGDINMDGIPDIAVGAPGDDDGGEGRGAIWILYLDTNGTVKSNDKITPTDNLLTGFVGNDFFGSDVVSMGDRSFDGQLDLLFGVRNYKDTTATSTGAVILAHLVADTTYPLLSYHSTDSFVISVVKHSASISPLDGELGASDVYGASSCNIGDLDGDEIDDIVVGAISDDDGGGNIGAVYVNFMNLDGTIKNQQKISSTRGNFQGGLYSGGGFGTSVTNIGDIDNDGIQDIAVGAITADDGGTNRGEVWILFMTDSGYVKSEQKISDTTGNFTGVLSDQDYFGHYLAGPGDIDGDGVNDLIVGTPNDDDGFSNAGAIWVLFLDTNGTVKSHKKISSISGGFSGTLAVSDAFGEGITPMGDIDNDGIPDIAVAAKGDDDGGSAKGAVYILQLTDSGTVKSESKISKLYGEFEALIENSDQLGIGLEGRYDLDFDGVNDLLVSAVYSDNCGSNRGEVWMLYLNSDGTVKNHRSIGSSSKGLLGQLDDDDLFGSSISIINHSYENSSVVMCIGAKQDDDGFSNAGAMYAINCKLGPFVGGLSTPKILSKTYVTTKKKLNGGYYQVESSIYDYLPFKYDEEYYTKGQLTFQVFDEDNQPLSSAQLLPVAIGDNRYELNMAMISGISTGYYVLELKNNKEEKRYLRFKRN